MNDLEVKVNRKFVYEESSDNLSDLVSNMFATQEEKDDCEKNEIYIYPINRDIGEVYLHLGMIPINTLRKMLDKAEKAGANFVSIDFHSDHDEYDVYGIKVERTSEKELIDDLEAEWLKDEQKRKDEIKQLEEKLEKLKRDI